MFLRTLKVVGFKSFADRTRLEFEPGVTVVVGPNGSGKSNLVDAVAWVMGTQSTRTLRTEKMEDVIFAGTATRPALTRGEVTLIFDNGSRVLPLDLDEVSITRRLYRDGSSDYQINGVDCRLLDVQELLSDSGVGRHQHVIVGQGQLDSILNARPEDHRAVIEEAAGILKHRLRKERAVRRMERTDADVLRLRDILQELKRQMRPLRRQARAAERYDSVKSDVRGLHLYLGGEDLRQIRSRSRLVAAEETSLRDQLGATERERNELELRLAPLAEAAGEAGRALDRDTAAAARLETTMERLRRIGQVAHERRRSAEARMHGAGERRRDLEDEALQLEIELGQSAEQERRASQEADRAERAIQGLEDEERSLAEQEGLPVEGATAVVRGNLTAFEAAADRDGREARDTGRRLEVLHAQLEAEAHETERLREEIRAMDAETEAAQNRYDAAAAARTVEQASWQRAEQDANDAKLAVAAGRARAEALEHAAAGLADPRARELAAGRTGVSGTVATMLDIPERLALAVDAALGAWSDALAVESAEGMLGAVADLKANSLGGIPLVTAQSGGGEAAAGPVAAAWGVDALVDMLGPKAHPGLATLLLGDVILAESWSAAWKIVDRHPAIRAVTPEGDLIGRFGVRVADPDGASPAMVEAALAALEDAELDLARAVSRLTARTRSFDDSREKERVALEELESVEARISGATDALDRLERGRAGTEAEIVRLDDRRTSLIESEAERETQIEQLRARLAALEGEEAERQRAWDELAVRRQAVASQKEAARRIRQEAAAAHGAIVERRRLLERRLREVRGELQDQSARPVDPAQVARLADVEEGSRQTLALVRSHLESLRDRQRDLRRQAGEAGVRLSEARTRFEELRGVIERTKDQLSSLALEATELRMRDEGVAEGLRRDADATEAEALAAPQPEIESDIKPREMLEILQAELRRMGPINPLAAVEYRDLSERHDFLEGQLEDLEQSRSDLRKVVKALDAEIVDGFMAAFEEVSGHFAEQFAVLFPGGQGRLRLTEPDEPLTTGIDLEAQPLGKKVSRLSLLSGGEKSLAALAFLFAVFKARPSPFYVLDEVEAALDDANLRRFLRLVDQFRGSAQLVIVTHQQQTMEAADILYGVTMEPGGSSQVVAKRMASAPVAV
ncbi:MAG: chromosome segregation protein SMC [Acidimicrobiia bacterium]|nr:chromosome segregation protein SMC [Acidimicrobiia bacterium]